VPLAVVGDEAEVARDNVPDHLPPGLELGDRLGRQVEIVVAVGELGAEPVGAALDLAGPPGAHVVDGGEDLVRRPIDGEGGRVAGIARVASLPQLVGPGHDLLDRVRLAFAGGDQIAEAAGHVRAPGVRADLVAFVGRHQPDLREAHLRLVSDPRDLEHQVVARPLLRVLHEVEGVVDDVPHDLLAGHQLGGPERRAVHVSVTVTPLPAHVAGVALDGGRPPAARVDDGGEDRLGRLWRREAGREMRVGTFDDRHVDLSFVHTTIHAPEIRHRSDRRRQVRG